MHQTSASQRSRQNLLDKIPKENKLILAGDLNARNANEIIDLVKQRSNEDIINANG